MKKVQTLECEFCGKEIRGEPNVIKVEGALLNVCQNCTQFGKIVEKPSSSSPQTVARQGSGDRRQQKVQGPKSFPRRSKRNDGPTTMLIENYSSLIRSARSKKKLSQKNLSDLTGISQAQIVAFENGKIRPTDQEAKKIERELSITLFEEMQLETEYANRSPIKNTTIGDLISFEKRKKR